MASVFALGFPFTTTKKGCTTCNGGQWMKFWCPFTTCTLKKGHRTQISFLPRQANLQTCWFSASPLSLRDDKNYPIPLMAPMCNRDPYIHLNIATCKWWFPFIWVLEKATCFKWLRNVSFKEPCATERGSPTKTQCHPELTLPYFQGWPFGFRTHPKS